MGEERGREGKRGGERGREGERVKQLVSCAEICKCACTHKHAYTHTHTHTHILVATPIVRPVECGGERKKGKKEKKRETSGNANSKASGV